MREWGKREKEGKRDGELLNDDGKGYVWLKDVREKIERKGEREREKEEETD